MQRAQEKALIQQTNQAVLTVRQQEIDCCVNIANAIGNQAALVGGNDARGGGEDMRGRAVVLLEPDHLGAGEILLTSMDKDGTKTGYDLELTRAISSLVSIPVIASGGVGNLEHLHQGIKIGKASAVLAASIFHFGEFARIYQSFKKINECFSSNIEGSSNVFKFALKIELG
mgnify:CR=1 FL=1